MEVEVARLDARQKEKIEVEVEFEIELVC